MCVKTPVGIWSYQDAGARDEEFEERENMIVEIKNEAQYKLALDAAKSISEHYSQDIHLTNEIAPPYFDPLHGKHIEMSQITEHWANTLKQCTNDDDENKSMVAYLDICRGLVVSYCVHVREKCFRFKTRKKIS